ncbi:hypothetical protein M2459_000900 [Parabacteroides sp. PF5-5]|uniref:carbohydrate-binding domain-containing protein n=1 Tax=unclassified Parabacteroides TaxID=2649774 RepID=UPI002472FD94|nr:MULTISPECIES: carbohydrate-binding domain-containing protein [unclassified Parabacteroides]MDH6304172.1 hypothetical protein [Parabacteroides sp. PH5-39]MDH6315112.1 hypothetical protein [Parabacteroides sp. PF5-13]MDH6318773.1 hypothetical protein [Parabacteroides sp. PH5-13]MDH6322502.1 hypothetical protein [Parabacteroides sp. PH5-8]MDH6326362.1 hypothetical protein [Parabacteroides sp. PH5-41]
MKIKLLLGFLCITGLLFFSCSSDTDELLTDEEDPENIIIPDDPGDSGDDDLNPNSQNQTYENAVKIAFSNSGVTIDNPFENSGVTITNADGHISITSTITDKELNYVLSGITEDGSVKIYGEKKFGLILNGTGITNPNGAAINNQCKKKVMLTIVDETNNRLIDGSSYTLVDGEDMKATLFSEGNMEVSGNGTLEIRGKYKHALCVDGSLAIASGTINIKEAASDGIHTNDAISISGGMLSVRSASDAIECESKEEPISISGGTLSIITTGEKGHAIKAKQDINIDTSGSIEITVYGNASKGIKPSGNLTITKGDITINTVGEAIWEEDEQDTSSAAGIKCDGDALIDGGTLTIISTGAGGKGINVDGTLVINDGKISVTTTGEQYVYDRNNDTAAKAIKSDGNLTINGGSVTIRTYKTEAEGLESKATLTINNGEVDIEAYDDCINASTHIEINGGYVYCNSETNDGIDSNGTLTITGGTIVSLGSSSPEAGFDCDNNQFKITGGTLIGLGGGDSKPTTSVSTQNSLIYGSNAKAVL